MKENSGDRRVEHDLPLDQVLLRNPYPSNGFEVSASVDSHLEDVLMGTRTCTHTHTCNPPGPDSVHTHTCYHTHTRVFSSEEDGHRLNKEFSGSATKRPSGNREAVRKYREKKKAQTASLEEEVKKLRLLNHHLIRKLQGQAILEAEYLRLRSLLVDLRGKIDSELGAFPFRKHHNTATIVKDGNCSMQPPGGVFSIQYQTISPCFPQHASLAGIGVDGKMPIPWEGNCQPAVAECQVNVENFSNTEGQAPGTVQSLMPSTAEAD